MTFRFRTTWSRLSFFFILPERVAFLATIEKSHIQYCQMLYMRSMFLFMNVKFISGIMAEFL